MVRKTTVELPEDIWEDIQKRKFRNEGSVKDLLVRAYRAHFNLPQKGEPNDKGPGMAVTEGPAGDRGTG